MGLAGVGIGIAQAGPALLLDGLPDLLRGLQEGSGSRALGVCGDERSPLVG